MKHRGWGGEETQGGDRGETQRGGGTLKCTNIFMISPRQAAAVVQETTTTYWG